MKSFVSFFYLSFSCHAELWRTVFNNCICCTTVTTVHEIKISILLFIQLTSCLRGSKIHHLSHCSCVTIGHLPHYHHFYFHYNFIIPTPWVRGSRKRLSCLSHGDPVSDPSVLNLPLIYSPCLSSTGWHCWSLAKDNMIKPCAWATVEGNISGLSELSAGESPTLLSCNLENSNW